MKPLSDPTVKKWVDALRNDEYGQTTGCLKKRTDEGDYRYCCLGVLCDLIDRMAWGPGLPNDGQWPVVNEEDDGSPYNAYLPLWAVEATGITNEEELLLAKLNDRGSSFADIADQIEAMANLGTST